jgi:hypothetical protein
MSPRQERAWRLRRLRPIGTADTPATAPPLPDLLNELGGTIRVLRGPQYPSYLQLPLI